jgi:hypothetical protein
METLAPSLYWLKTPANPRRCYISDCFNEPIWFDPQNSGFCLTHLPEGLIECL